MPNEKRCEAAKEITKSKLSYYEINAQYDLLSKLDKYMLSNNIEKILRAHDGDADEGWQIHHDEIKEVALDYLVDLATAYCVHSDWKKARESTEKE